MNDASDYKRQDKLVVLRQLGAFLRFGHAPEPVLVREERKQHAPARAAVHGLLYTGAGCLCAFLCAVSPVRASTLADLRAQIAALETAVAANSAQSVEVVGVINALISKPLSLTVGFAQAAQGSTVDVPVIFKSGVTGVSSIQFDLQLPMGISYNSVSPGASATGAQKGVQAAVVSGGIRVLVFGINQNTLATGVLVVVKLNVAATASGTKTIGISGIVGSSASGATVPVSGTSGSISVQ